MDPNACARLRSIGTQLANVAFNWAQRPDYTLTPDDAALLRNLQRQWDEVSRDGGAVMTDTSPAAAPSDLSHIVELLEGPGAPVGALVPVADYEALRRHALLVVGALAQIEQVLDELVRDLVAPDGTDAAAPGRRP